MSGQTIEGAAVPQRIAQEAKKKADAAKAMAAAVAGGERNGRSWTPPPTIYETDPKLRALQTPSLTSQNPGAVRAMRPAPVAPAATPPVVAPVSPPAAPVAPQTPAQKFDTEQRAAGGKAFYDKPGTQDTTSGIYDRSTLVKPDRGGSVGNDVVAFQNKNAAAFQNTQQDLASARSAPIQGTDQNRKIAAAEAANEQARIRAESPVEHFRMVTPQGEATGLRSANVPRGGFVGAATDAEAARNDQARAQQDAAASSAAASMNRAADIMRETRMSKTVVQAPDSAPRGLFERAGDGYGDAEMRQNQFDSAVSGINERGLTRGQRGARAKAAEAMLAPFVANQEAATEGAKSKSAANASANNSAQQAQAQIQAALINAGSERNRSQLASATTLASKDMENAQKTGEFRAESYQKNQKAIDDAREKAYYSDGKNPPQLRRDTHVAFTDALDTKALVSNGLAENAEHARDLKMGKYRSVEEFQRFASAANRWDGSKPGWLASFFTEQPAANSFLTRNKQPE